MDEHPIEPLPLPTWLELLGTDTPSPGAGAAAAVLGATGAALVRRLALRTVGRERYRVHEGLLRAVAEEAGEVRDRLLALASEDGRAARALRAARAVPARDRAEASARDTAGTDAVRGSTRVLLEVMERSLEGIGLAKNAMECGDPEAAVDGATGAEALRAALRSAAAGVRANLASLRDAAYAREMRTRIDEMLFMGTKVAAAVDSLATDLWKTP